MKAELFQFSVNDFEADMKLHSLVLKELNVRMYSLELYDDYMSVVDAMDKKPVEEQNVNYYNNEKCWNRSRKEELLTRWTGILLTNNICPLYIIERLKKSILD